MKRVVRVETLPTSRYAACGRKQRYSKKEAITMAKMRAKTGKTEKLAYYECNFCQGWHLTHKIEEDE
jgi:hypothetical protein